MPGHGWACKNFSDCEQFTYRRPPDNECQECRPSLRGQHLRVQKKPAASVKKRVMKKPCGPRTEVARAQATDDAGEGLDLDDMDMELSQHLVFLEGYYGRVSALRVMAAACLFVRQCPSFIVASLVSIAAVLSIAVGTTQRRASRMRTQKTPLPSLPSLEPCSQTQANARSRSSTCLR